MDKRISAGGNALMKCSLIFRAFIDSRILLPPLYPLFFNSDMKNEDPLPSRMPVSVNQKNTIEGLHFLEYHKIL